MEPNETEEYIRPARQKQQRNVKPLIAAFVVLATIAVAGIAPRLEQRKKLDQEVKSVETTLPIVQVVKLDQSNAGGDVILPSNIQAIEQTTLSAHTGGYLAQRFVDIGSKVTKGQILATIQSPELDQQFAQSQAQAVHSQAGLGSAEADSAKLSAAIVGAKAEESQAQSRKEQARADLSHLKAKEQQAESAVQVEIAQASAADKRLGSAKAELVRSQASQSLARKTLARWKELEKSAAVAGQDVDEKQAAFDTTSAQVDASSTAVSSAQAEAQAAHQAIESARSEVLAAKADVQSGQGKIQAASSSIASSEANIEAARQSYLASKSGVAAASASISSDQADVRRMAALRSYENIVAPFSGVITARNVDVGDLVNASQSGSSTADQSNAVTKTGLFGLAQTDELRAQVNVPEEDVSSIREGQEADITVTEAPNKIFQGKVFHISGALDASTRTLLVEVRIDNKAGGLKPGMYAQITFRGSQARHQLWLPANALIVGSEGTRVAVVTPGGKLHYLTVTLGRDLGDKIQVLSGVPADAKVIVEPDDSLPEGTSVQVTPEPVK